MVVLRKGETGAYKRGSEKRPEHYACSRPSRRLRRWAEPSPVREAAGGLTHRSKGSGAATTREIRGAHGGRTRRTGGATPGDSVSPGAGSPRPVGAGLADHGRPWTAAALSDGLAPLGMSQGHDARAYDATPESARAQRDPGQRDSVGEVTAGTPSSRACRPCDSNPPTLLAFEETPIASGGPVVAFTDAVERPSVRGRSRVRSVGLRAGMCAAEAVRIAMAAVAL
jgi:hypothetical protein